MELECVFRFASSGEPLRSYANPIQKLPRMGIPTPEMSEQTGSPSLMGDWGCEIVAKEGGYEKRRIQVSQEERRGVVIEDVKGFTKWR